MSETIGRIVLIMFIIMFGLFVVVCCGDEITLEPGQTIELNESGEVLAISSYEEEEKAMSITMPIFVVSCMYAAKVFNPVFLLPILFVDKF